MILAPIPTGPTRDGWFEARVAEPPHSLVWWSQRGQDLQLTWALVLEASGPEASELYVRVRINLRIGHRAPAIVGWGGSGSIASRSDHDRGPPGAHRLRSAPARLAP